MSAAPRPARRLAAVLAGVTLLVSGACTAGTETPETPAPDVATSHRPPSAHPSWVATWGAAPTAVPESAVEQLTDATVRQVVHTSIGGDALRLRLTNEFGTEQLHLGEVRVAVGDGGAGTDIVPASDRAVTFGGATSATVPAGAPLLSDPVELEVAPDSDLVVSLYLPDPTAVTTVHASAHQVNAVADGNVTGAASVTPVSEPERWQLLSGVSVAASDRAASIVALGDSITDGVTTEAGANHRWPDALSDRLREAAGPADRGVVNAGISGNRLLHGANPPAGSDAEDYADYFGTAGLARFDRDVLAQPGAEHVITLLGVNDIGQAGGGSAPAGEAVTAQQLIEGHRQLVARTHTAGLRIYCGTILPFAGSYYESAENEATRQALNEWIRTSGECDAVVDFDAAVLDPDAPDALLPEYDGGDHLHPNDAGMAAMAAAVPLDLFG